MDFALAQYQTKTHMQAYMQAYMYFLSPALLILFVCLFFQSRILGNPHNLYITSWKRYSQNRKDQKIPVRLIDFMVILTTKTCCAYIKGSPLTGRKKELLILIKRWVLCTTVQCVIRKWCNSFCKTQSNYCTTRQQDLV